MLTGPIKLSSPGPRDERQWQRCLRNKKGALPSPKEIPSEQSNTEPKLLILKACIDCSMEAMLTRRVSVHLDGDALEFRLGALQLLQRPPHPQGNPEWTYCLTHLDLYWRMGGKSFSFSHCHAQGALHRWPWLSFIATLQLQYNYCYFGAKDVGLGEVKSW